MLHDMRKENWREGIAGVRKQYGGCRGQYVWFVLLSNKVCMFDMREFFLF